MSIVTRVCYPELAVLNGDEEEEEEEEENKGKVTVLKIDGHSITIPGSLLGGKGEEREGRGGAEGSRGERGMRACFFSLFPTARVSSFLYRNMFGFLDNTVPGDEASNSRLVGPVLSSFLHCGQQQCDTSSLVLDKPVRLSFPNPEENDTDLTCVFWKFGKRWGWPVGVVRRMGVVRKVG